MSAPSAFTHRIGTVWRARRGAIAIALASGLFAAPRAHAQLTRGYSGDSVPRELVAALLRNSPMPMLFNNSRDTSFVLYVGTLPPQDAAHLYVPPGGKVLGAAEVSGFTTGIVDVPGSVDSVQAQMKRGLAALDWAPPPVSGSNPGGGFKPPPTTSAVGGQFCRQNSLMLVIVTARSPDVSRVTLEILSSVFAGNACGPRQSGFAAMAPGLPTVLNPPGTVDDFTCSQTGMTNSTSGSVRSLTSPVAMLDFYGKQLADSGWTPLRPQIATATRGWTRKDSAGTTIQTIITVSTTPVDSTCRSLRMDLRRKP